MNNMKFVYKSFLWSIGTTSFRMADFHRKVEQLITLLDEFWSLAENRHALWSGSPDTQVRFYNFAYEKGFITGNITDSAKKAKTARQKTSALVDIGLIDDNRRLTEVGTRLLKMSLSSNFTPDNPFRIPCDSFLYLKQLLKLSYKISDSTIRPLLVTIKVLSACNNYLSDDEFTYLLPLCIDKETTHTVIRYIRDIRNNESNINDAIIGTVLTRYDYPKAKDYFIRSRKTLSVIMRAGMNRDGQSHDKPYFELYNAIKAAYIDKDGTIERLTSALKPLTQGIRSQWKNLLFNGTNPSKFDSIQDLPENIFSNAASIQSFDSTFFNYMHLFKAKSTLKDYHDLNRRYLTITDAFIFQDSVFKLTPIFEAFFAGNPKSIVKDAFIPCDSLTRDCSLQQINPCLAFDETEIVHEFQRNTVSTIDDIQSVYDYVERDRYIRFRNLIDARFPNDVILSLMDDFKTRENDKRIIDLGGGDTDVPTMFEYITGIVWYRISGYEGKVLDYMNLSLNADLLPRTHAQGGESDIVYRYSASNYYPQHTLLLECTLMESTSQRRGEMEPVSRHLAHYMIDYPDEEVYCSFIGSVLHPTVLSDFRMRKNNIFYLTDTDYVSTMKIIPIDIDDLKSIITNDIPYSRLYTIFDNAYKNDSIASPVEWHKQMLNDMLQSEN